MQFRREQREVFSKTWYEPNNWFRQVLGEPARAIVEKAYGARVCSAREKAKSQEYLTLTLSLFARKVGAEKSHVVHALLTGRIESLQDACYRKEGIRYGLDTFAAAYLESFREVGIA